MSAPEYTHQCRYCAFCVYTMDENWWCDEKDEYINAPKRPNRCNAFLFNTIPADKTFGEPYRPRKKSNTYQPRLFDMPTDKQREKLAKTSTQNQQGATC